MPAYWFRADLPRSFIFAADKWVHGVTFMLLAVWFSGQYARGAYWRIAIGLVGFGIMTELCQGMVSYRMADVMDLWADAAGILVGLVIAVLGAGGWSLRFEGWLQARRRG